MIVMYKGENRMEKPIKRSPLRAKCGMIWYRYQRYLLWIIMYKHFAKTRGEKLPYLIYQHQTILLRELKDVEMQLQMNKITNLKIAAERLNGIIIYPNEVFSYWKLIGKVSAKKGYIDGMILQNGHYTRGLGGGLCQMSNLIYWMTLHTPLTVIERHRHGYDVFPDAKRTQPFGSGATCYYPHLDLMIRNDTDVAYQLNVKVGEKYLEGEWRAVKPNPYRYEIVERNHQMRSEYWGGASRHNELYRLTYNEKNELISDELVVENHALMMYSPFLAEKNDSDSYIR